MRLRSTSLTYAWPTIGSQTRATTCIFHAHHFVVSPCKQFPLMSVSLLTLRADDSGCKLRRRLLAADGFVTLALAQRYLVSRALHAAHHHLRHVAAVPVPGFLRARDQTIANNHAAWRCRSKKTDVHDSCLAARRWNFMSLWLLKDNNRNGDKWLSGWFLSFTPP